jgi:hypothetical protein
MQGTAINGASTSDMVAADGSIPFYMFAYNVQPDLDILPPHDHRDNFNGGFAFAVFHPGTQVPQQPWSV